MSWLWLWLGMLVWAVEGTGEPPLGDIPSEQEREERVYALAKILRCPVCQGLSVEDSRADAAVAMKNRISELVEMGYTDEQVIDYFIARYGEWVLLKPKSKHIFLWIAPLTMILIGSVVVWVRVSQRSVDEQKTNIEPQEEDNVSTYRSELLQELED